MINVLVTRPAHQADALCQMLDSTGFAAVRFPLLAIEVVPLTDDKKHWLDSLQDLDWLVFISANAVSFALSGNNGKIHSICRQARVAAVGLATAKALQAYALEVNLVPAAGFNSEALLATPELQAVQGKRFLCIRGQGGRELLAETLRERGAIVDYLEVYRRMPTHNNPAGVIDLIAARSLDVITLTSGEAMHSLLSMFGQTVYLESLLDIPLVVISERLRTQALESGFKCVTVSNTPGDAAIVNTIISLVGGEYSG